MTMELYRKSVRIRLCFEERGILSKAQADQGLAKSWYLVNADVLSIGQLGARIGYDYRLRESCPQGLVLEMSGFVLPPAQSTRILQDSDLVSVRRKQDGVSGGQSRELITNSLSVDNEEIDHVCRIGRGGLLALDEFEKEAGGYQSEHSEDADAEFSFGSGKNLMDGSNGMRKIRAKESSGKKRKRSFHNDAQTWQIDHLTSPKSRKRPEGLDLVPSTLKNQKSSGKKKHKKVTDGDHGSSQILALEGLPRSEHIEGGAKIEKKKKKKKIGELVEQTRSDLKGGDITGSKELNAHEAKSGKGRKAKSVKEPADLEGPHMKVTGEEKTQSQSTKGQGEELNAALESTPQKLTPEASREGKKSRKRQDTNQADHGRELLKKEKREVKGNDGSSLNKESSPGHANSAEKKQPSRSARRKKAKKRWLREQAQNGVVPKKDDVKPQQREELDSSESESSEEDAEAEEAEAEEEILPIMVAPGHLRFERDEDVREEEHCAPTVVLSYPEVRCKKQGQAWGQEKSQGRYSEDGHDRRSGKMEDRSSDVVKQLPNAGVVADKIDFEKLPLLYRAPGVGDLLAYRLVELTASWTPELSNYRVGKVSSHDDTTKMISITPVPEYPVHVQQPEDAYEDGQPDVDLFLPPYNSDGTLEVNLSTLMEVRVLEEGPRVCSSAVEADIHAQESADVNATAVTPIEPLQPVTLSSEVPQENVESAVCINLNTASSTVSLQSNQAEFNSGGNIDAERDPSLTTEKAPAVDQATDGGWQDVLSEEINKKKLELACRAGKGSEGQNSDKVPGQAPTGGVKHNLSKDGSLVEDGRRLPRTNGAPIIRHRYMRTGALGPTMALLRASQVL